MNTELPGWISYVFLGAVAWALSALLIALRVAADTPRAAMVSRVVVFSWLGVPAFLAIAGVLSSFDAEPPMLMRVVVPCAVLVTAFAFSPFGRVAAEALPLSLLIGFQAFRVPVELVLHSLYAHGHLPREMTFAGYNFDIVTGISALGFWILLRSRDLPKGFLLAWNTFGLTLLVTIVTLAILSFPEPFGWFTPENRVVAYFPWVFLPTFLVPLALLGHLLVYRKLLGSSGKATAAK